MIIMGLDKERKKERNKERKKKKEKRKEEKLETVVNDYNGTKDRKKE